MFVWLGDWTYLILIPGIIAALIAQIAVKNAYAKYSSIQCGAQITGADIARKILDQNGALGITVEMTPGVMSDHYDPRGNVIRLSQDVYNGTSIAALGIAAHESGHALQHNEHYAPLAIRNAILPIANIGSAMAFPLVLLGLLFDFAPFLADIGVLLFGFVLLFQLITLPVEFNASRARNVFPARRRSFKQPRGCRRTQNAYCGGYDICSRNTGKPAAIPEAYRPVQSKQIKP